MPFGEKAASDGRVTNFDVVHRYIIADAIKELRHLHDLDIECTRSDDIEKAGPIDTDMFAKILEADIAIVDITMGNPNVFYELGMRHALKACVTILIGQNPEQIPFNIRGLRTIGYDTSRIDSFDSAKELIQKYVVNGLRLKCNDSPIREALPGLSVSIPRKALPSGHAYLYRLSKTSNVSIGVITGELEELRHKADVWVSSENTELQLARFHDRSISGLIRYLGARKDQNRVAEDCIGNAVAEQTPKDAKGRFIPVEPGSITPTASGELEKTHGVKRIFHAATVQGTAGKGYVPVANITVCIKSALAEADSHNKSENGKVEFKSILFPVFGTGVAGARFRSTVKELMDAALNHVENHGSTLETIYFLASHKPELTACLDVLKEFTRDGRLLPANDEPGQEET